jgi:tetratricopeptide (TPR) repeat protein
MNFLERMLVWFTTKRPEPLSPLASFMLQARRAQYAENYDESLRLLDEAEELAKQQHEITALVDITLSKADNYIYQEQYAEAEQLINELKQRTEAANHRAPLAYSLCSAGMLAQLKGQDADARAMFERALKIARTVRAIGAEARAEAHLADTYLREGNASYAIHLLRDALPRMENSGDTELLPYFMLRLGEALAISGTVSEAIKVLEQALVKASEIQHRRYSRQIQRVLGEQSLNQGNYAQARTYFEAALSSFPQHKTSQTLHTAIQIQLSLTLLRQGEFPAALKNAQEALERASQLADAALIARAQAVIGMTCTAQNDAPHALAALQAAIEYEAQQPHRSFYIELLRVQAQAYMLSGEHEQAHNLYHRAIEQAVAADLPGAIAQAHTDNGLLYERERQLHEALNQYNEAYKRYDAAHEQGQAARLYCYIGRVRSHLGQGKRALKDYEQALTRLGYVNDISLRGLVLAEVALAYMDYGDMDSTEGFFTQAIEAAEQSGDKIAEATRRTHYGRFLALIGDARPAITSLMEARSVAQSHKLQLLSVIQADGLALAYRVLLDDKQAQYHHAECFTLLEAQPNDEWRAICQIHRGQTYLAQNDVEQAVALFNAARQIGETAHYPAIVARAHIGLALAAIQRQQPAEAVPHLEAAASITQQSYSRRLQAELYLAQSQSAAALGKADEAQTHWQEAEKIMKTLRMPMPQPVWLSSVT